MRSRYPLALVGLVAGLGGACVDDDQGLPDPEAEISIADDPDPLSDEGRDDLFVVTLEDAKRHLRIGHVDVLVHFHGASWSLNYEHVDTNFDGYWDVGESLEATEPIQDMFNPTHVGQEIEIEVSELDDGNPVERATGLWLAE
jgi:hypothetical protein